MVAHMAREIKKIVIHCADTPSSMDIGAEEIKGWHTDLPPRGNGWSRIGYHYVIRRDGSLEYGVDETESGIHVRGHNADSIAICLVGGKPDANFTKNQWKTLENLVEYLAKKYPNVEVMGHRDLDSKKTCPCFDVKAWWNN